MADNNYNQNGNYPQQNGADNNAQPIYQQPAQNGYYQQQPQQNGYYQQQPVQNNNYQQQQTQNGYYQQPMQNGYNQQPYQNGYNPYANQYKPMEKRSMRGSLVALSVVGLVFALLLPLVTYVVSIIGLCIACKNKVYEKTQPAIVMNTIALVVAVINSILGILLNTGAIDLF